MKQAFRHNAIYALLILAFLAIGCNFENVNADDAPADDAKETETGFINENQAEAIEPETQIKTASIVGKYDYDTEKDGEGFDNSMEITDTGDGKLYVFISGSYIYKMGETQTMKEAEGKGDAVLRGNTAAATLVDEAGNPCRAAIIFKNETAEVKIPDSCRFNIALGGVYKKVGSKPENKPKNTKTSSNLREVKYSDLMDFVNDFESNNVGDQFIITQVPVGKLDEKIRADKDGNQDYKNLFYLEETDDDGYVGNALLVSLKLLQSLEHNAEFEPAALRMTAVLAESMGKFDVYRISLVTRIEGLGDDGAVIWTADGGKPSKIKFTH